MKIAVYSGSFNPLHIGHLAIIKHMIEKAGFDMVYLIVSPKNPLKDGISSATGRDRYLAAVEAVNRHFCPPPPARGCLTEGTEDAHKSSAFTEETVEEYEGYMPPPARGCLTKGKAGVSVISSTVSTLESAKVKVDDIELTMPEPHYTIRTLHALKQREPQNCFNLVMGADNLADIRRWKDYAMILKEFGTAVFPRTGYDLDTIKQDLLNEDPAYKIQILDAELVDISSTQIREALKEGKNISDYLM